MATKWHAWGEYHDSHGRILQDIIWLAPDDKPDGGTWWRRMPWLDSPSESASERGKSRSCGDDDPVLHDAAPNAADGSSLVDSGDEPDVWHEALDAAYRAASSVLTPIAAQRVWKAMQYIKRPEECGPDSAVETGALSPRFCVPVCTSCNALLCRKSDVDKLAADLAAAKAECERLRGELAEAQLAVEYNVRAKNSANSDCEELLSQRDAAFAAGYKRAKADAAAACRRELAMAVGCIPPTPGEDTSE